MLLHCITSYPAPENEYNVSLLASLAAVFGVEVGLSDHSMDPVLVPALAVLHGARVVEKHFTLSRAVPGSTTRSPSSPRRSPGWSPRSATPRPPVRRPPCTGSKWSTAPSGCALR